MTLRSLRWVLACALAVFSNNLAMGSEKQAPAASARRSPAALVSRPELRSRIALEPSWSRDLVTPNRLQPMHPVQKARMQRVVSPQSTGFQTNNFHRTSVSGF